MIRIGICDDDRKQVGTLHDWIVEDLFEINELTIRHFHSGEEVVDSIKEGTFDVQLLFLDIHMHKMNGMETAAYIRQSNLDVDIIFLTVSRESVYDGYMQKAYAYLLKPLQKKKFKEVLGRYMDDFMQLSGYLEVKIQGTLRKVWLKKVLYFASESRVVYAHCIDETIRFYDTLSGVEEKIKSREFVRCHQSFLVNRSMIQSLSREQLMINEKVIPVSRQCYREMKRQGLYGGKVQAARNVSGDIGTGEHVVCKTVMQSFEDSGAIVGIAGKYTGAIIRIRPNQKIVFGRDHEVADIVLDEIEVSRNHCWIQYNGKEKGYYVCDQSTNGVVANGNHTLTRDSIEVLESGDTIQIANTEHIYKLG